MSASPTSSLPPKKISLFGATGSVGTSALQVIEEHPGAFLVDTLIAHRNVEGLAHAAQHIGARCAIIADPEHYSTLKTLLSGTSILCGAGPNAVLDAAQRPVDLVLAAIVGACGLLPTFEALKTGATIALANKECLVCAGDLFMAAARPHQILPVDSEHSAIFQCLEPHNRAFLDRLTLTASGGPFRGWSQEQLESVTIEQALKHPNWSMGPKITIDSATLMNKGLEVIEASYLFGIPHAQIDVVVHPQSILHSLVSYRDGSTLAQMGVPDMRTPIAYALGFPHRLPTSVPFLDLTALSSLTFSAVDHVTFPALLLARHALDLGKNAPTLFNAANEAAVALFLRGEISFLEISSAVERALNQAERAQMITQMTSIEDILAADAYGRSLVFQK